MTQTPGSHLARVVQVLRGDWAAFAAAVAPAGGADDGFSRYAGEQHVAQYVLGRLGAAKRLDLLPESWLAGLHAEVARRESRTRQLPEALAEAVDALDRAGVECQVLKGLPFAQRYYGDPALRRTADVDLLVRPRDCDAALNTLWALGYRCRPRRLTRSTQGLALRPVRQRTEHALALKRGEVSIDLHWRLRAAPAYRLSEEAVWADPQATGVGGRTWRIPSDEQALLLLSLSIAHDVARGGCRLKHLLDVHYLLRSLPADYDWSRFFAHRAQENTLSVASHALALVLDVLGTRPDHPALAAALVRTLVGPVATPQEAIRLVHGNRGSVANLLWFARIYPIRLRRDAWWFLQHQLPTPGRLFVAAYRLARFACRGACYLALGLVRRRRAGHAATHA